MAIIGALAMSIVLPAFISLGLWQWRKYETKTHLQTELDTRSHDAPVLMPSVPVDADRQILLDNQLHQEQAGYHVITPLKIAGSTMHVLVNRGWVAAPADHKILPVADVPAGEIELTGIAILPAQRFFNLAPQPASGWDPVWQNLDIERYRHVVDYPLQPVIIQLDPGSPAGYLRQWPRPDERADRHLSYALQWFGFAVSSLGIWGYFLVRRQ